MPLPAAPKEQNHKGRGDNRSGRGIERAISQREDELLAHNTRLNPVIHNQPGASYAITDIPSPLPSPASCPLPFWRCLMTLVRSDRLLTAGCFD
ncbi:hypothetical protein BaRGS_00001959 [Batillaria attramentaria]|uniref:Uncharacterized protein n=1 Tax=Batillaria attramentaria TaxID=370345 RepID=A0ABD0M7F9_9CAEN